MFKSKDGMDLNMISNALTIFVGLFNEREFAPQSETGNRLVACLVFLQLRHREWALTRAHRCMGPIVLKVKSFLYCSMMGPYQAIFLMCRDEILQM